MPSCWGDQIPFTSISYLINKIVNLDDQGYNIVSFWMLIKCIMHYILASANRFERTCL